LCEAKWAPLRREGRKGPKRQAGRKRNYLTTGRIAMRNG